MSLTASLSSIESEQIRSDKEREKNQVKRRERRSEENEDKRGEDGEEQTLEEDGDGEDGGIAAGTGALTEAEGGRAETIEDEDN